MTLGPGRKKNQEKSTTKGRKKIKKGDTRGKARLQRVKASTREEGRSATLPSTVGQLQGKTTHVSVLEHQGWLVHPSTEAHNRIAKKTNFTPNVRHITCSSQKKTTVVMV